MDTCFLFTKHLDDQSCFCLKLSATGEINAAPAQRSFADIKLLQQQCKTLVVETAANVTVLELELPWLAEQKAKLAIPYALEDKLAQPIEELHFAFDKLRYQNNHYLITIIAKKRIEYILHTLNEQQIKYDTVTVDWFALGPDELCISETVLLVNNHDFKGALTSSLALNYIKKHPLNEVMVFADSSIKEYAPHALPQTTDHSWIWLAQRLEKTTPLNLCQGAMLQGKSSDWIKRGYQLAAALCGIWLAVLILVSGISLHILNNKTQEIDRQIATIYFQFFPEAKQVITPKFRISQLLGNSQTADQHDLWYLLNQLAKVIKDKQISVEELRYQRKTLLTTLVTGDFASLEQIETQLKKLNLKVNQTQASTRDQQVVATLELM